MYTQDDDAAREKHSQIGAVVGGVGTAASYATIGTFICPGIGTAIGAAVGYVVGSERGAKNETATDNVVTAVRSGFSVFGFFSI